MDIVAIVLLTAGGLLAGFLAEKIISWLRVIKARREAEKILAEVENKDELARKEFEKRNKDIKKYRQQLEKSISELKNRTEKLQNRLESLQERLEGRKDIEERISSKIETIKSNIEELKQKRKDLQQKKIEKLEEKTDTTAEEIRSELEDDLVSRAELVSSEMTSRLENYVENHQEKLARNIIVDILPRCDIPSPADVSTAVLKFPDDDAWKKFQEFFEENEEELVEDVNSDVRFNDKRQVAIVENMEPVAKEIAYRTLNNIIQQKKFDYEMIESGVEKYTHQVEDEKMRAGRRALQNVGVHDVPEELVSLLGVLRFRTSFGQPQLIHSQEVAILSSLMAAELGADPQLARRAGILHDLGKAVDRQRESGHAVIGAEIAEEAEENDIVVNSIGSHHDDMEPNSVESLVVAAADAISGSRPGARQENVANYSERIENLLEIARSRTGIKKVYAMNAGRELRIWVNSHKVSDEDMQGLAAEISTEIEEEVTYSGEIKVNTIRRTQITRKART